MSTRVRYESRTGYRYPDAAATSTEMTPHASHEETSNTGQQSSNSSATQLMSLPDEL